MSKYYEQKETIINHDTGEQYVSRKVVYKHIDTKYYTKLFTTDEILDKVFGVNVETALAMYIISNIEFKTNRVYIFKKEKQDLANRIGKNIKSINNALTSLIKKGYIIRSETLGCYILNPSIAYKGNEKSRLEVLRLFEKPITTQQLITNFENDKV